MRKDALAITVSSLVMGVFGAFLRWLQNRTIFEDETGLAARGAVISMVYVAYSLLAAVAILGFVLFWFRRYEKPLAAGEALRASTVLPAIVSWGACAVFMVGGIALMFSAGISSSPRVQRVFGACAVIAGACFPFLPARHDGETQALGRAASAFAALFFCFWLVFSYLTNAQNPVLWSYGPEILAIAASTLAFYYVSAWYFSSAKPDAALFCLQLAVFLNVCALPDARSRSLTALLAATTAMLLLLEFLAVSNLTEKAPGAGDQEET